MARLLAAGDNINCGTSSVLNPTAMTACGWVYPTALTNDYAAIISRNTALGYYQLLLHTNGKLACYLKTVGGSGGSNPAYDGTGSGTLSINNWYHVGFSYSDAIGLSGYISGAIDVGPVYPNRGALSSSTVALTFGIDTANAARKFIGRIADFAIYNAVLTTNEMIALYRGRRPPSVRPGALVGYWPIDGIETTEPDLSGNRLNGTVSGTSYANGPAQTMFTRKWPQNYDVVVTTIPLSQTHFRFRTDTNAVDATPTWGDAEDAA